MKPSSLAIRIICLAAIAFGFAAQAQLSLWRSLTPSALEPQPTVLLAHQGRIMAGAWQGKVHHSKDARFWDTHGTPQNKPVTDLDFIEGQYWATTSSGIYSSVDGISWTPQWTNSLSSCLALERGNDAWVAVGYGSRLWSSTNGTDWVSFDTALPGPAFNTCVFAQGLFVAAGNGTFGIWTSPDGREWTEHTLSYDFGVQQIRFLNNQFVAVGAEGKLATSPDGLEWTRRSSQTVQNLRGVTYGAGKYLAVGGQGAIIESPDGVSWRIQPVVVPDQFNDVAYVNGQFVVVGSLGTTLTSTDGQTWTTPNPADYNVLEAVTAGPQGWVAVGDKGVILFSADGRNWERRNSSTKRGLQGVVMTDNLMVAVGAQGTVVTSTDGMLWTLQTSKTTRDLNSITYSGGQFVTGGPRAVSTNGIDWAIPNDNFPQATEVVYGNDLLVSVGFGTQLASSVDGQIWTKRSWDGGNELYCVAAGLGQFVAAGDRIVITSTNGIKWTTRSFPKATRVQSLAHGSGQYLAVGFDGDVFNSTDGVAWTEIDAPTTRALLGVAHRDGVFIAVGATGTILRASVAEETILTRERLDQVQGFEFRFTSIPGRAYQIQTSADLQSWTAWQEVTATQPLTTVKDGTLAEGARHYRLLPK